MKGLTTILAHKKWVFAYVVLGLLVWLLRTEALEGSQFMMGLLALIPCVIGASSFEKSKWRTDSENKSETAG